MLKSNPKSDQSYVDSTSKNYQSRHQKFSSWAEEDQNASAAKKCRELFLHFLSVRVLRFYRNDKSMIDAIQEIRVLDAGCGSGRDLKEFSKTDLSIPFNHSYFHSETSSKSITTCFNNSCYICEKQSSSDGWHDKSKSMFKDVRLLKISATGFDICPGFVDKCMDIGLDVILDDFSSFILELDEKSDSSVSFPFSWYFCTGYLISSTKNRIGKDFKRF